MTTSASITDHLLLGIENSVLNSTLSVSPAAAGDMQPDNIKTGRRDTALRVIGGTATLTGALSSAQSADLFSLSHHNLTGVDTWRLQLFTTSDASGAAVYDSGAQTAADLLPLGEWRVGVDPYAASLSDDLTAMALYRFDNVYFRSFALTLSTANEYCQMGYLFIGQGWQPAYNFRWGQQFYNDDRAQFEYTLGGTLETINYESRRRISLELGRLTDSDRNTLLSKLRQVGSNADIVASLYPSDDSPARRINHSMICKIPSSEWSQNYYDKSSTSLKLMEV